MVFDHCAFYFRNLRKFVWPCNVHRAELGTFLAGLEQGYPPVLPDLMHLKLVHCILQFGGPDYLNSLPRIRANMRPT